MNAGRNTQAKMPGIKVEISNPSEEMAIATLKGDLDIHNASSFALELKKLIDSGKKQLVVDLGQVDYLDSSGLGALVTALHETRQRRGTVTIISPKPQIRKILEITALNKFFEVYPTLDEFTRDRLGKM